MKLIKNNIVLKKLFYKIGEASEIVGVAPHVLRYWEKEFKIGNFRKSNTTQRHFSQKDILTFLKIRELLHEKRFTIEGAKKILKNSKKKKVNKNFILEELKEIKSLLSKNYGA
jgi:DNA-binding transcriptional MerR regulator